MKKAGKIIACSLMLGFSASCINTNPPTSTTSAPGSTTPPTSAPTSAPSSTPTSAPTTSVVEYEEVSYKLNVTDSLTTGTSSDDIVAGKFTVIGGTEVRNRTKTWEGIEFNKSIKIGSNSAGIKVNVPGEGKLAFWIQNGSNGAATQKVKITKPDGKTEEIEFTGTDGGSPVVKLEIDVTEGVYTIGRVSGTIDIFQLEMTCQVEKAEETGFEIIDEGKDEFILGEAFDSSKLQLNKVFGNGRTDALDLADVKIDSSAYNANKEGTYPIKIKYKEYDEITYNVNVYSVQDLELGMDAIEKLSKNTSAGNGVYYNHSVKEVYAVGEEFDVSGLNVTIKAKCGDDTKEFLVDSNISYSGFDSSTPGKKTVTVTYSYGENLKHEETFDVFVVATAPSKVNDVYQVAVDDDYDGEIGAVVNNYNKFSTIQQALDYLESREEITAND